MGKCSRSKIKNLIGEDFSRFHVWASAKAIIAIAILAINLWLCMMQSGLKLFQFS
jgi:hypothetical protein